MTNETDPKDWIQWNNKGVLLAKQKRFEEALECLDQSIKLNLQEGDVWLSKGHVLIKLRRYKEALQCFRTARSLGHQDEQSKAVIEFLEGYGGNIPI